MAPIVDTNQNPLDRLHRTREVAKLQGISTRTLYEHVKDGLFPPPDVPAERHGAPAYWYESTIRKAREARQTRVAQIKPQAAA